VRVAGGRGEGALNACDCGADLRFDAEASGTSCGGLELRGALVCVAGCGRLYIAPGSVPADSAAWKLAKGGRSVDTGRMRLRVEGRGAEVEDVLARVARLPELERALKRIAAGEGPAAEIAAAVLARPAPEPA
jgi:uncharacterized membrane protein